MRMIPPEGTTHYHAGTSGLTFRVDADGTFDLPPSEVTANLLANGWRYADTGTVVPVSGQAPADFMPATPAPPPAGDDDGDGDDTLLGDEGVPRPKKNKGKGK